jgi:Transglutaminase-like superfamily
MTRRRRGWFDLPRDERRAVITMVWLVPALHVAVRVWDYRRTRAWLEQSASARRALRRGVEGRVEAYRLATARVTRYSWLPGNCLSRSLALLWLLRRNGHDADLHLGVSLAGGEFAAHAWVTLAGRVLNDTQDVAQRYAPLRSTSQET